MELSSSLKPPSWLIVLTAAFTLVTLMMAVAETTLWTHYLIDQGEYVSIAGLVFILAAGFHLHRRQRLWISLPLSLPWLLFPVITQGDQIIDNLTINQMRLVVHLILAVLFGAPVVILVVAGRHFLGLSRRGMSALALVLLLAEFWVAYAYLGVLMIATLIPLSCGLLLYMSGSGGHRMQPARANRLALSFLVAGTLLSFALYATFKSRPGAYQGSPHFYHDPSHKDAVYPLDEISVPSVPPPVREEPELAGQIRSIFEMYGEALEAASRGYYILDRNYNYAFHNALFLRNTPLLPGYRRAGLEEIRKGEDFALEAARRLEGLRPLLRSRALLALLDDTDKYASYTFRRAGMLEEMTANFEKTQAGLQHATHVYEGEGKILGAVAEKILEKHKAVLSTPEVEELAKPLRASSEKVFQAYANRIVGF